jgi:hypothetical protein
MKNYSNLNINERINFKAYFMHPYRGFSDVFNEIDGLEGLSNYHKSSPHPISWDKI